MSYAKREDRPYVSAVDSYILRKCTIRPAKGRQLKPFRCRGKRDAEASLKDFSETLKQHGSFFLTFDDQVTVMVYAVHGIHDRGGKGYNNARRYFVVCEIEND